jgi:SsrA-binding protein
MHRREIDRLFGLVGQKGYSIIPLSLYFKGRWVKVELGLCKGKKLYDKRAVEAEKSAKREIERADKGGY